MDISYIKTDPTGNITGLIESPVEAWLRPYVAEQLLLAQPDMEQVGFVSACREADIRLDMTGGEFCGNATLSAAALHLRRLGKRSGKVRVSVSGADAPVNVEILHSFDNVCTGIVDMPLPLSTGRKKLPTPEGELSLPVVCFPGISHVIAPGDLSADSAEALIVPWCEALQAEALGLMLFDRAELALRPLVWVPGASTLCWERSCASGTAAVGAWTALSDKAPVAMSLCQKGGNLGAYADVRGGRLLSLRLKGRVTLHDTKTLEII